MGAIIVAFFLTPSTLASNLGGYIQVDYREDFKLERARISLDRSKGFTGYRLEFGLEDEVELLDVLIRLDIFKRTHIEVGKMKPPFSREQILSPLELKFSLYPWISSLFHPEERKLGARASVEVSPFKLLGGLFSPKGKEILLGFSFEPMDILEIRIIHYLMGNLPLTSALFSLEGGQGRSSASFVGEAIFGEGAGSGFYFLTSYSFETYNPVIPRIELAFRYETFSTEVSFRSWEEYRFSLGLSFYIGKEKDKASLNWYLPSKGDGELMARIQLSFKEEGE
ncbi:MAG: hypothetical protein DRI61_05945 [Chloroflexi bacterium]|nr:MAG: hypothetical protein DRI61_05945 [Chloroflexota bacterium]